MKKKRESNLELYRIIVMLLIVAHHYVVNSGLVGVISDDYYSGNSIFYWLFGMWGKTGINCFVLITGYFMCTSNITLRKFLKLILQIEFYYITISLIFLSLSYNSYSFKDFVLQIIPIKGVSNGFTSGFILFWLTIPFLNILIKNLSRKQHILLIGLFLFIYTGMLYIPHSIVTMNYVSWFIVLYFISSYIRLHPQHIYKCDSIKVWGLASLLSILLAVISVIFICWRNEDQGLTLNPTLYVSDSNAVLALLVGVTTFMFFKNIRMSYSKVINNVASTTFGVLLIHANSSAMRNWLWKDTVDCVGHCSSDYYYLYAPLTIICIFAVCSLIDYIRIHTIEAWTFKVIDKYLQNNG